jgi:hypothetical protein
MRVYWFLAQWETYGKQPAFEMLQKLLLQTMDGIDFVMSRGLAVSTADAKLCNYCPLNELAEGGSQ